jgi:myb proto-oncogene protein
MQQNGHYELHPVDHHPFEAIGDYVPIGSMVPPATFNDLGHHQYFSERDIKKPIFSHASSTCHRVGSQLPMSLTPKTEVSHLIESGLRSYKAYETSDRFVPRKKTSSYLLKKANVVKGQWTPEEDR